MSAKSKFKSERAKKSLYHCAGSKGLKKGLFLRVVSDLAAAAGPGKTRTLNASSTSVSTSLPCLHAVQKGSESYQRGVKTESVFL